MNESKRAEWRVRRGSGMVRGLASLCVLILCFVVFRQFVGGGKQGVAPVPAMFDKTVTLEAGEARAAKEGKVVFAFATADWCGPCQQFKRDALADARVEEWVRARATPVYIDVDERADEAERLSVSSIPAVYVLRDGRVLAKREGVLSAKDLLAMLQEAGAE